jgi:hypothetical protein
MTNSQLAKKVYEVLEEKCDQFKDYNLWCEYLKRIEVLPKDYEEPADAADELAELVNEGTDHIICFDPFPSVVKSIGGYQFLMVPQKLAEKIAVLGAP